MSQTNETSDAVIERRRDTLKIIGAIGTTCAFPFSANELYGQQQSQPGHQHETSAPPSPASAYTPKFFNQTDYKIVAQLTDLIIPPTDTPGAVAAGVPAYIDDVVSKNKELQATFTAGLTWLKSKSFPTLSESARIALLTPVSAAIDNDAKGDVKSPEAKFFRAAKNLTADGYYTSYQGLVTELGYQGNQALAAFPACELPMK